jgi:hypothetical protein
VTKWQNDGFVCEFRNRYKGKKKAPFICADCRHTHNVRNRATYSAYTYNITASLICDYDEDALSAEQTNKQINV